MKVELEGSLRKALLKRCLWMGESEGGSEGGQDEISQKSIFWQQQRFTDQTYGGEKLSKFYCF